MEGEGVFFAAFRNDPPNSQRAYRGLQGIIGGNQHDVFVTRDISKTRLPKPIKA